MTKKQPAGTVDYNGEPHNFVWIELPKPRDAAHAQALCDKANLMLRRLLGADTPHKFSQATRRPTTLWSAAAAAF